MTVSDATKRDPADPVPGSGAERLEDARVELPPLLDGQLSADQLEALIDQIDGHARRVDVRVKGGAEERSRGAKETLRGAMEALVAGEIRGMQIRYEHEGARWTDTVLRAGATYRVIRVSMDEVERRIS